MVENPKVLNSKLSKDKKKTLVDSSHLSYPGLGGQSYLVIVASGIYPMVLVKVRESWPGNHGYQKKNQCFFGC